MPDSKGTLLVIDDETINRTVLAISLQNEGFSVETAQNGNQALELLHVRSYDLVLLDLIMPGMDGYELLAELKADPALRYLPVIVISGVNEMDSVTRCIEMGAADYIPKPIDPILLRARVNASLASKHLRDMERAYMIRLQEEQTQLQALINSSRDGLILISPDNFLRVINPPAIQFLRLPGSVDQWVHQPAASIVRAIHHISPQIARNLMIDLRQLVSIQGNYHEGIFEFPPRYLRWQILPVNTGDNFLGRLFVIQDITEARQVEAMREELTRTMVHDLRNPLGNIRISLDLLTAERADMSEYHQELLSIARNSTGRMLNLVNAILDISQLESGQIPLKLNPTPIKGLIEDIVRLQMPQALKKNLQLECSLADQLPLINVDEDMLARVLQNLLGNAIKFTPIHGNVRISASANDTVLCISVQDDGPGISPDIQPRLFQKFVTGRIEGRGSGLGLAFCRLVIQAHKGEIWVESIPGQGSTFKFTLPLASLQPADSLLETQSV